MDDDIYYKWFKEAVQKIKKLQVGDTFTLKSIFDDLKWKSFGGKVKRFGSYFSQKISDNEIPSVKKIENTSPTKYKKIK